jgi:hypothetical protein
MTPAPEQEYIITETDRNYILSHPEDMRTIYGIMERAQVKSSNKILDELGKMLNKRIAKMEVLDSQNPSQRRKGILMAYREIEEWERLKRKGADEKESCL